MVCLLLREVASDIPLLAQAILMLLSFQIYPEAGQKCELLRHKVIGFADPKNVIGGVAGSEAPCRVPALLSVCQCGSARCMDNQCPRSYLLQPCLIRNVSSVTMMCIRVLRAARASLEQAG